MASINKYFFSSLKQAAGYVYDHLKNPTPIKVQKGLYFIWAFYAVSYGKIAKDSLSSEPDNEILNYPPQLFEAEFEAWKDGPVIRQVWEWQKRDLNREVKVFDRIPVIGEPKYEIKTDTAYMRKEVLDFISDLLKQVDDVSDYELVTRSKHDKTWKNAVSTLNEYGITKERYGNVMDKQEIINEYEELIKED